MFGVIVEKKFALGMFRKDKEALFAKKTDATAFMRELFGYEYPDVGGYFVDTSEEDTISIRYREDDSKVIERFSVTDMEDKPLPLGAFRETFWNDKNRLHSYNARFADPYDGYLFLKAVAPEGAEEDKVLGLFVVYGDDRVEREIYFVEQIHEDGTINDGEEY